jgi:hypothetical protein
MALIRARTRFNPYERPTAREAMKHPYFDPIRGETEFASWKIDPPLDAGYIQGLAGGEKVGEGGSCGVGGVGGEDNDTGACMAPSSRRRPKRKQIRAGGGVVGGRGGSRQRHPNTMDRLFALFVEFPSCSWLTRAACLWIFFISQAA